MTVTLKWLGHAAVQLDYENTTVIIDPFLTGNPKFPGDEHKPTRIDLMLITHGHNDHFGDAISLAKEFKPAIPVIHEMSIYLMNQGVENVVGMNFGGTWKHDSGIEVTLVPSSHSGGYTDADGVTHYLGDPGGYVIRFPDGNSFYHCGDTGVTREMKVTKKLFKPRVGLLAIGGHYTMDPKGAAYAADMMDLEAVVPIHYGTWNPPLAGTPDELRNEMKEKIEVKVLEPGQTLIFN